MKAAILILLVYFLIQIHSKNLDFRQKGLMMLNDWRFRLRALPFELSQELNEAAQIRAKSGNIFSENSSKIDSPDKNYGESFWCGETKWYEESSDNVQWGLLFSALETWFLDEEPFYNYEKPGWSPSTSNFTQLLWRQTKSIGFGVEIIGDKGYVIAKYNPKAKGGALDFKKNIGPSHSPEDEQINNPDDDFKFRSYADWYPAIKRGNKLRNSINK